MKERLLRRGNNSQDASLRVREARPSDLPFIEDLSGRVFGIYGPYRDWVSRWFQSDSTVTIVALIGGKSVGFAMLGRFSQPPEILLSAELLAIAVEPSNQRAGAGRMLMKEIEKIALSIGVNRLFLHTAKENTPAQKLFASCLFIPSNLKRKFYPAGQDALLMVKDLF